jgi:hydroxyacylglutathione hydrolase
MPLEPVVIPCLSDNYAYLIHDGISGRTAVIDVPEAAPVQAVLADRGWILSDIWLTHHHWDHIDGVEAMTTATGAKVTGAAADAHRLPPLDQALSIGQGFDFAGHDVAVIDVPGHTIGHIAFYIASEGLAFTGDTLMAAGCGKMAEGNAPEYWQSLQKLANLAPDTLICSGHEYTSSNLAFALSLEPGNRALMLRSAAVAALRAEGKPSVPVKLAEEIATTPFLRAGTPEMKAVLGMTSATDTEVFAEVRRRKDRF